MCTHSLNNWLFLPFQTNDEHISFLRKVLGPSRLEPMTVCLKSTEMLRAGTKTVHSLQAVDKVGLRLSLLKLRNAGVGIKVDKKVYILVIWHRLKYKLWQSIEGLSHWHRSRRFFMSYPVIWVTRFESFKLYLFYNGWNLSYNNLPKISLSL